MGPHTCVPRLLPQQAGHRIVPRCAHLAAVLRPSLISAYPPGGQVPLVLSSLGNRSTERKRISPKTLPQLQLPMKPLYGGMTSMPVHWPHSLLQTLLPRQAIGIFSCPHFWALALWLALPKALRGQHWIIQNIQGCLQLSGLTVQGGKIFPCTSCMKVT